jgi:hypothetical protein
VDIPETGFSGGVQDNGVWFAGPAVCTGTLGGPCRVYTFTLTTTRTFSVTATWDNTSDEGIYFTASDGTTLVGTTACDSHGNGATAQPETCTVTDLPAGTYYLIVDDFSPFYGDPAPGFIDVSITGQ